MSPLKDIHQFWSSPNSSLDVLLLIIKVRQAFIVLASSHQSECSQRWSSSF